MKIFLPEGKHHKPVINHGVIGVIGVVLFFVGLPDFQNLHS
jgi:hypothetical protein